MDEVRMNGMLSELENASNYFRTRCAQLAAELAFQVKRADEAEAKVKELTPKKK